MFLDFFEHKISVYLASVLIFFWIYYEYKKISLNIRFTSLFTLKDYLYYSLCYPIVKRPIKNIILVLVFILPSILSLLISLVLLFGVLINGPIKSINDLDYAKGKLIGVKSSWGNSHYDTLRLELDNGVFEKYEIAQHFKDKSIYDEFVSKYLNEDIEVWYQKENVFTDNKSIKLLKHNNYPLYLNSETWFELDESKYDKRIEAEQKSLYRTLYSFNLLIFSFIITYILNKKDLNTYLKREYKRRKRKKDEVK